jgi:hypothetical protein
MRDKYLIVMGSSDKNDGFEARDIEGTSGSYFPKKYGCD